MKKNIYNSNMIKEYLNGASQDLDLFFDRTFYHCGYILLFLSFLLFNIHEDSFRLCFLLLDHYHGTDSRPCHILHQTSEEALDQIQCFNR